MKPKQESTNLQIENDEDTIKQWRTSRPTASDNVEHGSLTNENEVIDDETYLQSMAVDRNWEISRNRLTISTEKFGRGEFGVVNKGVYLRTDGNELPVAVKSLKGSCRLKVHLMAPIFLFLI